MNYSKILKYDTANGPGIRTTIWVTGCCFRCPECFNSEIQDFNTGKFFDDNARQELYSYLKDPHVTGLSILGGEPLIQDDTLLYLLKNIRKYFPDKTIWMWTGFQLRDIIKNTRYKNVTKDKDEWLVDEKKLEYISYVDYLVDGPFIKDLTTYHTRFRGSSNQIIWKISEKNNEIIAENVSEYFDKHEENNITNVSEVFLIKSLFNK